jgi:hypothetical protein
MTRCKARIRTWWGTLLKQDAAELMVGKADNPERIVTKGAARLSDYPYHLISVHLVAVTICRRVRNEGSRNAVASGI